MSQHIALAEILIDVEKELRELRLWEAQPPSAEALASVQPFAVATRPFAQWSQLLSLRRPYEMINAGAELPDSCGVAPSAQEYFHPLGLNSGNLINHLRRIDVLLTRYCCCAGYWACARQPASRLLHISSTCICSYSLSTLSCSSVSSERASRRYFSLY